MFVQKTDFWWINDWKILWQREGECCFYGDYGNKYENKTTQKKNKTTNLNHHVIESAMKQIEDVLHDSDSDENSYLIESAKKQIGYTSDDSDSDDDSMLFLN